MGHKTVFSANLKKYMALNHKSRKEVCEALGYSYFTFSDWVNGKKMPRMDRVEELAAYFGIAISDLVEEKAKKENPAKGEVSAERKAFIDYVMQMSEEDFQRLKQIRQLLERE